jgi:hypothetical protein
VGALVLQKLEERKAVCHLTRASKKLGHGANHKEIPAAKEVHRRLRLDTFAAIALGLKLAIGGESQTGG